VQRDPVHVVRSIYAAWNGGDWGIEHFHPDVEWEVTGAGGLDQVGRSHGRDALLSYWRRFWAAWKPGARWEIEQVERVSEDEILASGRLCVVGRSSGVETETPTFHLWTVRDGVVVRLLVSDERETALRASG
jgi:ketosteroid isomerase-like protein